MRSGREKQAIEVGYWRYMLKNSLTGEGTEGSWAWCAWCGSFLVAALAIVIAAKVVIAKEGEAGDWQKHWAYQPLERPNISKLASVDRKRVRGAVDWFIQAKLKEKSLTAADEAAKGTLLRRATLDVTGLLPTLQEQADFLADDSPDAFERVIDRLMASPRAAERSAVPWLDLARYADTHGYHSDSERQMWRYRDWVLLAYAQGMPFDQFTREQLAGDLLPQPSLQQQIATGLQRNHMLNNENGAIAEEFLNEYICDRVATLGTIWLGQTLSCARCHDHKYDPVSQRQFYSLYAFFHNVPENGLGGRHGNSPPWIVTPTDLDAEKLHTIEEELNQLQMKLALAKAKVIETMPKRLAALQSMSKGEPAPPNDAVRTLTFDETEEVRKKEAVVYSPKAEFLPGHVGRALLGDGDANVRLPSLHWDRTTPFSISAWIFTTTGDDQVIISQASEALDGRGVVLSLANKRLELALTHLKQANEIRVRTKLPLKLQTWVSIAVVYDGSSKATGVRLFVDGKACEVEVQADHLTEHILTDSPLRISELGEAGKFRGMLDELQWFERPLSESEVGLLAGIDPYLAIWKTPTEKRTAEQKQQLEAYVLSQDEAYQKLLLAVQSLEGRARDIRNQSPTTMVMQELPVPRKTFVLERGMYDKPTEEVTASVPSHWGSWKQQWPNNRLGLAEWLVDTSNPLPPRVLANRLWQQAFPAGLVRTSDDFGLRGEMPTHPELLEWLACELVEKQWDTRLVTRRILSSHTYRQSSLRSTEQTEIDPDNRLLASGPRYRLPAEMVRDTALQASGVLVEQFGGHSVRPYQPGDLWKDLAYDTLNYGAQSFTPSSGAGLYRRSVYTYWKRTVPPPGLGLLDAPNRETCQATRPITNTPLQSLLLLNDVTYVEAARGLAQRAILAFPGQNSPSKKAVIEIQQKRIDLLYRVVLGRGATPQEQAILSEQIQADQTEFLSDPEKAENVLRTGFLAPTAAIAPEELAAWTMAASVVLNLDEAICQH